MKNYRNYGAIIVALLFSHASFAGELQDVQAQWAIAQYELEGKPRVEAFEQLSARVEAYLHAHPDDADMWVWSGIVKSTMAGAKGGLGALALVKAARKDLEHSLTIDEKALNGSAYSSLGTMFHKVPGWPIGFGSDKKAREFLEKALSLNPQGIDPNYFYGELLFDEGEYTQAHKYLLLAQSASPRPDRPLADKGRQQEISTLLNKVESKLKK